MSITPKTPEQIEKMRIAGRLAAEVTPVEWTSPKGPVSVARDDHLRPDTTPEKLAALTPAFSPSTPTCSA